MNPIKIKRVVCVLPYVIIVSLIVEFALRFQQVIGPLSDFAFREYGVPFYNATVDLKKALGESVEDYYFKDDMHFNYEGFKIYSEFVGKRLYPSIQLYLKEQKV